jgi:two-component system cell cycle sensor histidine kinase/response regulator CckA
MYQEEKTRAADAPEHAASFLAQRTRKSRYQAVIDAVGDLVYGHAADGILTAVNPAIEQMLGWKPEAWIGEQFTELVHPDEVAIAVESMEACLRGDSTPAVEFRLRTSAGDYRLLEFRHALDGRAGEPPCVIGIARDVTERRRLESQQRALEAWRADVLRLESLSALATGVAHDLNNVLTAIHPGGRPPGGRTGAPASRVLR